MNPKATAVLFAVAAALAAFVYYYEIEGEQARVEAQAAEKRLFPDVEQSEISRIAFRIADAPEIRLERRESGWRIAAPIDFAADTFAADGLASALTQLKSETAIDDPRPAEVYGFGAQGGEVRFAVGDLERTLRIGNETPVGSNSYAAVDGDDRVFTVASYQLSSFKKELDEFRDKRIVDFDPAAAVRVAVSWPGTRLVVERDAEGWRMTQPLEARADGETIDDLLSSLSFLRAAGFVDEPISDEEAGLAEPEFAVEIELSRTSETADPRVVHFAVGGLEEGGAERYARGAADSLYTISETSFDDFPRRRIEYRDRQLSKFERDAVRRVELGFHSDAGETVVVSVTREGDGWTSSADSILPESMNDLVRVLSNLRADDITAEELGPDELQAMGLDPAKTVLLVYGEGDPAERLAELHLGVAFGEGITARIPDRETIFRIGTLLATAIPKNLEDFRERFVAPAEASIEENTAGAGALDAGSDGHDAVDHAGESPPPGLESSAEIENSGS